ncbi:UNVERIFIED_CONTAM: hypothetical protein Slati_3610800 [Sesamum latifolium]|uniref:Uncharacterized protein n=1 Tax=Sesamum latifolium TaxID=2727402 RepID=A0AAW2TYY9_9LAMI
MEVIRKNVKYGESEVKHSDENVNSRLNTFNRLQILHAEMQAVGRLPQPNCAGREGVDLGEINLRDVGA